MSLWNSYSGNYSSSGHPIGEHQTSGQGSSSVQWHEDNQINIMPQNKRSLHADEACYNISKKAKTMPGSSSNDFNDKMCLAWFKEYADPKRNEIGPEGMEKFCADLQVAPENVVMLCVAWKLGATRMGYFSKEQWMFGMKELKCDCIQKLQGKLPLLLLLLDDPPLFKNIFRFAFDFIREDEQRNVDTETGRAMLSLLLKDRWILFPQFDTFLAESVRYRVLNKDQWCNILEFSRSIKSDLSNYEEDGAWPVMLDEFVEWYKMRCLRYTSSSIGGLASGANF